MKLWLSILIVIFYIDNKISNILNIGECNTCIYSECSPNSTLGTHTLYSDSATNILAPWGFSEQNLSITSNSLAISTAHKASAFVQRKKQQAEIMENGLWFFIIPTKTNITLQKPFYFPLWTWHNSSHHNYCMYPTGQNDSLELMFAKFAAGKNREKPSEKNAVPIGAICLKTTMKVCSRAPPLGL